LTNLPLIAGYAVWPFTLLLLACARQLSLMYPIISLSYVW